MTHGRALLVHPSAELYGSDRVTLESAAALADAGWAVVVALGADGPLVAQLEKVGAVVHVVPMPVLRKNLMSPAGATRFAWHTLRAVPRSLTVLRRARPDLVYVGTVTVPLWLLLARLTGRRTICHLHEAEESLPRIVRFGLALPLLLAHLILANSELSKRVIVQDLAPLRHRTQVVYNGVAGPAAWFPPRPVPAPPVRLVLVGRISPRKGTDTAVQALALLCERGVEVELTLVGGTFPGYEWFAHDVQEQARAGGVADRVRWAGVLADVWDPLASADIALVPSRVEPFGNAAVEAMLACRPVVVGDSQGLREVVESSDTGERVSPGDPAALADAVQRVLAQWPAAVTRAEKAREQAERRFGVVRYRREVVAMVERLIG